MQDEFEMSMMGELTYFLGLQVKQAKSGIFIHQSKYCTDLLKKFKMLDCNEAPTPMATNCYLDLDEAGKNVDQKMYKGMIESLLYLTASRPDIMHNVCLYAKFQSSLKESHLTAVKRILEYLKGTQSLGLWYPNGTNIFLEGYSDSDFGGCKLDRKSTSGTCHLFGSSLVSWHSKKQACVTLSTTEAEYIAAGSCCTQSLWIKSQLEDYDISLDHIPLKYDNTSAINLTKNHVLH
ncbi:secreted RxLR effector protein 161-like [Vigna angularis]|uniref:secreted RxLR effector protein 161-like n=1 Tax=Phaseolus angularis TaxID=3914 RepID=UPI00080A0592|nr:secreted RxLR effector protein 161-like [Vigna angularis]